MNAAAESIAELVDWIDPSERLVLLRRAARSVRRLPHVQLPEIETGWTCVRHADTRLAAN
jgi:hypothetical protein